MHRNRHNATARAATLLVLLALALGLPQFLIVCAPTAGVAHLDFACSAECGHSHADSGRVATATIAAAESDGAPTARSQPPRCVHIALGCELAPTPAQTGQLPLPAPAGLHLHELLPARAASDRRRCLPDTTGPPRPKPVLLQIATVVMQR